MGRIVDERTPKVLGDLCAIYIALLFSVRLCRSASILHVPRDRKPGGGRLTFGSVQRYLRLGRLASPPQ